MTESSSLNVKWYSQSGQDEWAHSIVGDIGTFLDIGAGHPSKISNTYALEQMGWAGLLVERDHNKCVALRKERKSDVLEMDARNLTSARGSTDYLSLDVDDSSIAFDIIARLTLGGCRFRCMTIEHELYKEGPQGRDAMRFFLMRHGYKLAKEDVLCEGLEAFPYEDWYIQCEL